MAPITWSSGAGSRNNPTSNGANNGTKPEGDRKDQADLSFTLITPRRQLADLVLSAETERALSTALARIEHHEKLYQDWGLADIHPEGRGMAINLYGAPGTGKTFAAEAIAAHLDKPLLQIDYAQIESRFVGDTPKNIVAAFRTAAEQDAVLFFDEADSMLSRRATTITQAADYGVNISRSTLLLELDRFTGVTIFATNLARNYDPAFVRRILAHVYFPLPDHEARVRLWRLHLPDRMPRTAEVQPDVLADLSDGMSGGDILNAVILAASGALQRSGDQVTLPDFETAIRQVTRARQEVGSSHESSRFTLTNTGIDTDTTPGAV